MKPLNGITGTKPDLSWWRTEDVKLMTRDGTYVLKYKETQQLLSQLRKSIIYVLGSNGT